MRTKATKKSYSINLEYASGITRTVLVKAVSRETAESRALKRNPAAVGVKRNA